MRNSLIEADVLKVVVLQREFFDEEVPHQADIVDLAMPVHRCRPQQGGGGKAAPGGYHLFVLMLCTCAC